MKFAWTVVFTLLICNIAMGLYLGYRIYYEPKTVTYQVCPDAPVDFKNLFKLQ